MRNDALKTLVYYEKCQDFFLVIEKCQDLIIKVRLNISSTKSLIQINILDYVINYKITVISN